MNPLAIVSDSLGPASAFSEGLKDKFETKLISLADQNWFDKSSSFETILLFAADTRRMFDVLKQIKNQRPIPKVLVVLEVADDGIIARAIECGAEDWVVFPLNLVDLQMRVLRMMSAAVVKTEVTPMELELGEYRIFPRELEVLDLAGNRVHLAAVQMSILLAFSYHRDQLLSRDWLKKKIWNHEVISNRSIDAQISKLKALLPKLEHHLVGVYGRGYIYRTRPNADLSQFDRRKRSR